jgi:hypothetical protein
MGLCSRAVGAVVITVKLTAVELVVIVRAPEKLQLASLGRPEQEYVKGRAVVEPDPFVSTNVGVLVLVTVKFTALVVWPRATESVATAGLATSENFSVVALTARLMLVTPEDVPDDPFTVTEVVPGVVLASVWIVNVVVPLPLRTLVGLKEQLAPAGNPEQLNVTVPVNPLFGVSVMLVVVVVPAATVAGVKAEAERLKGESA